MEQIHKALEKFVRAYEHKNCVHTTLLAEAYEDAKAALAAPSETIGNDAKMREGCITFAEAIEHLRRGAMIREKGTTLWTWRGIKGQCYYGLKRNHPLHFRDAFLCAEVFGDGEWEVKNEAKGDNNENK